MTPDEAWEIYVGSQTVGEFVSFCTGTIQYGVREYVENLDNIFGVGTRADAPSDLVELLIAFISEDLRTGPGTPLRCTRCSHEWRQRRDAPPERCPKCNSPYWDKKRRAKS